MDAQEFQEKLDAYLDGSMEPAERADFEKQVAQDMVLRAELEAHQKTIKAIEANAEEVKAPADLAENVLREIDLEHVAASVHEAEEKAHVQEVPRWYARRQFQAVAVLLVLAVGTWAVVWQMRAGPTTGDAVRAFSKADSTALVGSEAQSVDTAAQDTIGRQVTVANRTPRPTVDPQTITAKREIRVGADAGAGEEPVAGDPTTETDFASREVGLAQASPNAQPSEGAAGAVAADKGITMDAGQRPARTVALAEPEPVSADRLSELLYEKESRKNSKNTVAAPVSDAFDDAETAWGDQYAPQVTKRWDTPEYETSGGTHSASAEDDEATEPQMADAETRGTLTPPGPRAPRVVSLLDMEQPSARARGRIRAEEEMGLEGRADAGFDRGAPVPSLASGFSASSGSKVVREPTERKVAGPRPSLILNVYLRPDAPRPLQFDTLRRWFEDHMVETRMVTMPRRVAHAHSTQRYATDSVATLRCTIRGRGTPWVLRQLEEIGLLNGREAREVMARGALPRAYYAEVKDADTAPPLGGSGVESRYVFELRVFHFYQD